MSDDQDELPLADRVQAAQEDYDRIAPILDQVLADMTSCQTAMALGETDTVVDEWVDRVWNGLRRNLNPEDRLCAIVFLLESAASANKDQLIESYLVQP